MRLTLRTKGALALCVLFLYVLLVGLFVAHERNKLVAIVEQIESDNATHAFVTTLVNALGRSLLETQAILSSPHPAETGLDPMHSAARNLDRIAVDLAQLRPIFPALAPAIDSFGDALAGAGPADPVASLTRIRDSQQRLIARLNAILVDTQARSADGGAAYRETQQWINLITAAANVTGALATAAVILIFFTRLAKDIHRLQDRAVAVVAGYDGEPLPNTRHDEIGGLIDAVNRMQADLRRWEHQQEVSRAQRFHKDKMAAVGSLAAAISHEVSNPIAAISGVAQFIVGETHESREPAQQSIHGYATQILHQTERVASMMRRMAALTESRSRAPELIDLNALVESTCGFITFDQRFAGVRLDLQLDRSIPAVTAVPDHITQILMNLLINAADAVDPVAERSAGRIVVATTVVDGDLQLSVTDNGLGMESAVLARAFDESFTTKPAGKGRGIGLFLCKALATEGGGRMNLRSAPGAGTTVDLFLPLVPSGARLSGIH